MAPHLHRPAPPGAVSRLLMRLRDVAVSGGLLAVLAPLAIADCALAVLHRRTPLRPASYLGAGCRQVHFWRLAPPSTGRLPRLLRRLHADAAPLLLEVLIGRMSLVGPRPIAPAELVHFASAPQRLALKPGLVCLWWLRRRCNVAFAGEAQMDAEYAGKRGLRQDWHILLGCAVALVYGAPSAVHARTIRIGGITLCNVNREKLIEEILAALARRQRTKVAFVNPDCVNIARRDAPYRQVLDQFELVCADGIGMTIAGRLLGQAVRQNLNGTDLFAPLCAALERHRHSVFLLGGRPGVAHGCADWIAARFPDLRVAGCAHGYFGDGELAQVVETIAASKAEVLLVAMGAPRQEQWLHAHLAATGAVIGLGVGGLFDFHAGRIPRAPQWLRDVGGEWLFRLRQEPARMWRRYLIGNWVFMWHILMEKYGRSRP